MNQTSSAGRKNSGQTIVHTEKNNQTAKARSFKGA